jgi:hypothetical protein
MNGDNCQPFRYRFNIATQTFYIDYIADKAKHALVDDDSKITISLGILLEYLKISLQDYFFNTNLPFNYTDFSISRDQQSVSSVKLAKGKNPKEHPNQYNSLSHRITNRNLHHENSFDDIDINQINQNLTYSQCMLLQDTSNKTLYFLQIVTVRYGYLSV